MRWRKSPLPKDWPQRRAARLALDGGQCTATLSDGTRCPHPATDVHHLDPNDHRIHMLRSRCDWHHKRETSKQANAAQHRRSTRFPQERHPGLKE
jgi:5-methylcytosine-specific restriction protein A